MSRGQCKILIIERDMKSSVTITDQLSNVQKYKSSVFKVQLSKVQFAKVQLAKDQLYNVSVDKSSVVKSSAYDYPNAI